MSNYTSNIPKEVQELLADLSVIRDIPPMSKFNVHDSTYIRAFTIKESVFRWMNGEGSERTINYIDELISWSVTVAKRNPPWFEIIRDEVANLRTAIENQVKLYSLYDKKKKDASILSGMLLRIEPDAFTRAVGELEEKKNPLAVEKVVPSPAKNDKKGKK